MCYEGRNYTLEAKRKKTLLEPAVSVYDEKFYCCKNSQVRFTWSAATLVPVNSDLRSSRQSETQQFVQRSPNKWPVESLLWYSLLYSAEKNQWEQFSLSNFDASSRNLVANRK